MPDVKDLYETITRQAPAKPDALEALRDRRDRKRRNQRITAGVVGIALFAAAVWLVVTGGPIDRTGTPASEGASETGATMTPPHPGTVGLVGFPPADAAPSSPNRGELVLSFMFGHTNGDPGRFGMHVYADGRVIWERLVVPPTGLIEQRLTPAGVDLVVAEMLSAGLFARDLELLSAHGLTFGDVRVRNGDGFVRVTWGDSSDKGAQPTMPTEEQANALKQLDARLEDLSSWLPADAWADPEMRPYVPSRYGVCYEAEPGVGLDRVLSSLPGGIEQRLRPLERTHEKIERYGPYGTGFEIWCSTVTTEQGRELAGLLEDAGVRLIDGGSEPVYETRERAASEPRVGISFSPVLPDGI